MSSVLLTGELVPLELSLIDRPLSSNDDIDPAKLLVRLRLAFPVSGSSYVFSSSVFTLLLDDIVDEVIDDVDDDCANFRLHLDWPDSRKPLAKGLLSIFSLVMRSFCKQINRSKLDTQC